MTGRITCRTVNRTHSLEEFCELHRAAASVLARVDLSGFPVPITFRHAGGSVGVRMPVADRQTGRPREVEVGYVADLEVWSDPERALRSLRGVIQKLLLHELDECLRYDGRLPFDPHGV